MAQNTKNDTAWEKLFDRHDIIKSVGKNGVFHISATEINTVREARLMTKFDHSVNLPHIFQSNSLCILPDSRGTYVIGHFDCYQKLPRFKSEEIEDATLPSELESLSAQNITSEPAALLCAHHAGMISNALEQTLDLTIFGRMGTGKFDFSIRDVRNGAQRTIAVDSAQCEIDGGYEGAHCFALIEAKKGSVVDFNVRQLYYPFRLWSQKLRKPVVPVFFTYSNEVFSFYLYRFNQPNNYNSLEFLSAKHYQIVPTEIEVEDVRQILAHTPVQAEPDSNKIPFPQADTFERIIDLLTTLAGPEGYLSRDKITTNYEFDVRQTSYYTSAGIYLGLVERHSRTEEGTIYKLTPLGIKLMGKDARSRNLALVEIILSRQVFRDAMKAYLKTAEYPPKSLVIKSMNDAKIVLNNTTLTRRVNTVLGWIRWIAGLTKDA